MAAAAHRGRARTQWHAARACVALGRDPRGGGPQLVAMATEIGSARRRPPNSRAAASAGSARVGARGPGSERRGAAASASRARCGARRRARKQCEGERGAAGSCVTAGAVALHGGGVSVGKNRGSRGAELQGEKKRSQEVNSTLACQVGLTGGSAASKMGLDANKRGVK